MYPSHRINRMHTALISLTLLTTTSCSAMLYFLGESTEQRLQRAEQEQKSLEQCLTSLETNLANQDYKAVDLCVKDYLDSRQSTKFLDWIQIKIETQKDPYCFYRYIRNNAMVKRSRKTVEGLIFEKTLRSMIAHLILIAGDIAVCLASGDELSILDQYKLFRDTYEHWYSEYFLEERISFERSFEAACKWLNEKEHIKAPYHIWIRYTKQGGDRYTGFFNTCSINFTNPPQRQRKSCALKQISELTNEWRAQSLKESLAVLAKIKSWDKFFALGLEDLNPLTIFELTGERLSTLRLNDSKDSAMASDQKSDQKDGKTEASIQKMSVSATTQDSTEAAATSATAATGSASSTFSASSSAIISSSAASSAAVSSASASTMSALSNLPSTPQFGLTSLKLKNSRRSQAVAIAST
jgi:hypothetical protein